MFKRTIIVDTILNASMIPQKVDDEIRAIWAENCLGNDFYYFPVVRDDDLVETYPALAAWLDQTFPDKSEKILLHHWW